MFTNLIESDSHRKEFKRRSSFFVITIAAYSLILLVAGTASILAYDARLESQNTLEVLNWIPPAAAATQINPPRTIQPPRNRPIPSTAPVDTHLQIPMRTDPVLPANDPTKAPDTIATTGSNSQTVTGPVLTGDHNANPPGSSDTGGCPTCTSTQPGPVARVEEPRPTPEPVRPQIQHMPSTMLMSKIVSLPQPPYPMMAKQIKVQGAVPVQILIDESGKVVSAHAVSGNPFLTSAAESAATRAGFTPTVLNGVPVKVQGVITYNFVLQ
jgi:protein TonB